MANFNNPYNNYPYGNVYQPFTYPYGNMNYQGNNNQQINNQQMQQPQMNQYAFVNGIEGAKSFQMQPNQTILLMDSDRPVCYMKTTNNIGQASLRYFKLTEVNENELKDDTQPQTNNVNNDYVLKADFDALSKKVNDLLGKMEKPYKNENSKGNKVVKDE